MPLSDDEKRILSELEEQLQTDTKFANAVSSSGLYSYAIRKVRWATLGVLVSLVVLALLVPIFGRSPRPAHPTHEEQHADQ